MGRDGGGSDGGNGGSVRPIWWTPLWGRGGHSQRGDGDARSGAFALMDTATDSGNGGGNGGSRGGGGGGGDRAMTDVAIYTVVSHFWTSVDHPSGRGLSGGFYTLVLPST